MPDCTCRRCIDDHKLTDQGLPLYFARMIVCSIGWNWDDNDEGYRLQDEAFDAIDDEKAAAIAREFLVELGMGTTGPEDDEEDQS